VNPRIRTAVNLLTAGLISFGLGACLVAGPSYVVYDAPQKAGKSAPVAKLNLAEEVRARLHRECKSEHGGVLRADEKLGKQCDCFAGTVVKSMQKDEQEFYTQYGVVPTLSVARPNDVKKQSGISDLDRTGPREKLPPPET
jgi:hypothetical protein